MSKDFILKGENCLVIPSLDGSIYLNGSGIERIQWKNNEDQCRITLRAFSLADIAFIDGLQDGFTAQIKTGGRVDDPDSGRVLLQVEDCQITRKWMYNPVTWFINEAEEVISMCASITGTKLANWQE